MVIKFNIITFNYHNKKITKGYYIFNIIHRITVRIGFEVFTIQLFTYELLTCNMYNIIIQVVYVGNVCSCMLFQNLCDVLAFHP